MITEKVNIYDFDNTIYKGDASLDFIVYFMLRHPRSWRFLPGQLVAFLQFVFGILSRKDFKERIFVFLKDVEDIDSLLEIFWRKHEYKIAKWYSMAHKSSDIIISASPSFLLEPIAKKIGVAKLIATNMNAASGKISGENCHGPEKVIRLKASNISLNFYRAYSDSISDKPLLMLADKAYIVKGEKIIEFNKFKEPIVSQLKSLAMIRFIFVGSVNAVIGVLLSYGVLFLVDNPVIAFLLGYALSLVVSYFLNSVITFMNFMFSVRQFASFVVSYLPNFFIQFVFVYILIGLGVHPLISYIVAVAIAVPITFLLLSQRTFKQDGSK